jgi:signal transduction histidine kinase
MANVSFRAHARIKDIVGKDLINNDNIAIIELIKNSKDAGSKKVYIAFDNSEEPINGKITIQDFGRGMSEDDIKYKWLNIAYSEKRNTKSKYAGDKGVGRFSCDRLGKMLNLYSITEKEKVGHKLSIDWTKFEVDDIDKSVGTIKVNYTNCSREKILNLYDSEIPKSGTTLIISGLRTLWGIPELEQLKKELEKFVLDPEDNSDKGDFLVYLIINNHPKDEKESDMYKELSGRIRSKIFDKLNLRTTSISSSISPNGKTIITTLHHDGNDILKLKKKNHFSKLYGVRIQLYYLNRAAKVFFKMNTGYRSVEFGSVFMFRNGFRVFPYGEPDNDWLKLDKRKAQGQRRYIGTRELVGKIIIDDERNIFSPVSAREGLVENEAFKQLTRFPLKGNAGYFFKVFRKLENFVVNGLDWFNLSDEEGIEISSMEQENLLFENKDAQILNVLTSVVTTFTEKHDIIDLQLNEKYILSLAQKEKKAFEGMKSELFALLPDNADIHNLLNNVKFEKIKNVIVTQTNQVKALQKENVSLKSEITVKDQELQKKHKELKASDEENMFLRATTTKDAKSLENLMHRIANEAVTINGEIFNFRKRMKRDNYSKDEIEEFINNVQKHLQYVSKIAEFAINRNYRIAAGKKEIDVIKYIRDYLENMEINKLYDNISLYIDIPKNITRIIEIKPLELSIMIDNIVNNSQKAHATKLFVSAKKKGSNCIIDFSDNGDGISADTIIERIFEKGYTTAKEGGSGLGLYYLKEFVESDLKGIVETVSSDYSFTIRIIIPCN